MGILFSSIADFFATTKNMFSAILDVWFIILPPLLYFLFKILWKKYAEGKWGSKLHWVLLEIIPPRDIEKSPQPMESIFAGFAGVIKTLTVAEEWIKGEFPTAFSLEIASLEGAVHMYVRTQAGFRNLTEAHFYSQYPGIEIVEVPDYVHSVPKTVPNKEWTLWGTDWGLVKDDLYPIKTYKHFEESVTGKMIDPLAGVFDTMSKMGPGEHLWLQYVVTPIKENWYSTGEKTIEEYLGKVKEEKMGVLGRLFADIKDVFINIPKGILGQEVEFSSGEAVEKKDEAPVEFRLTPGEKDVLKALEANIGQQMFKTRMRYVYIARRKVFSKPTGVSSFIGAIKQFNDFNLNSLYPYDLSKTFANYVFTASRLRFRQRRVFNRYIVRETDPQETRFLFSAEELATVFHIPDMTVVVPTMTRVAAKRSGAPANLPVLEE